jgi:hypothetical protein
MVTYRALTATLLVAAALTASRAAAAAPASSGTRSVTHAACASGKGMVGKVRAIKGGLQVKRAHGRQFHSVKAGAELHQGDVLRTGRHQRAAMVTCDGSVVRLNTGTHVSLSSKTALSLKSGEIEQLVIEGAGDHQVASATMHASGHDADVKAGGRMSTVTAVRGETVVRNGHGTVRLAPDQQTRAAANTAPTAPTYVDVRSVTGWASSLPTPASTPVTNLGANLVLNGDAEAGPGGADVVEPVPDWQTVGNFTADQYGAGDGVNPTDPGPPDRGNNYFAGGPDSASSSASQTIDVSSDAATIDAGKAGFQLAAYLGGWESQEDRAVLSVTFLDASGQTLGSGSIGPVTAEDRHNQTGLLARSTNGAVPRGTRKVTVTLEMTRDSGSDNDGYADNVTLSLGTLSGS